MREIARIIQAVEQAVAAVVSGEFRDGKMVVVVPAEEWAKVVFAAKDLSRREGGSDDR